MRADAALRAEVEARQSWVRGAAIVGVVAPWIVLALGAAMVVGGLALGAGILPRAASLGLIASLLPTTVVGHPFWREQEPAARSAQTLQFVKNLSMLGGLVIEASSPEPRRR